MPIVLDYAANGAIIGGHFFSYVPDGAVESGSWQAVIPGAIYARLAHVMDPVAPGEGFLGLVDGGQTGVVGEQQAIQGQEIEDAVEQVGECSAPSHTARYTI